jgi:hypothetical protein
LCCDIASSLLTSPGLQVPFWKANEERRGILDDAVVPDDAGLLVKVVCGSTAASIATFPHCIKHGLTRMLPFAVLGGLAAIAFPHPSVLENLRNQV